MRHYKAVLGVLSLVLITACASEQPKPDPLQEEVTILQKQLLELQKLQNETKAKLDESAATVAALSAKVQAIEDRQAVRPVSQTQVSNPAGQDNKKKAPTKKKTKAKKKTKKARRQE